MATIATTLLRLPRQLIACKWTYARSSGQRSVLFEIRKLVVRIATDNPTWATRGLRARSRTSVIGVGRSTIRRIVKAAGLPPVPQRPTSWQTFMKAHSGAIAGADFFTTEVWTWRGLFTYYTAFVIDLASRRVQIPGSTPNPEALFMREIARTLTMAEDGATHVPHPLLQEPKLEQIAVSDRTTLRGLTQFQRRAIARCPQPAEYKWNGRSLGFEGGFCATLFEAARKPLILNGEMSEWSIEHAWKAKRASDLNPLRSAPTHT